MKFNLCIIRPEGYAHADAFWELTELLAYSLRDLGHDAHISINEYGQDVHNIVFGGHLLGESSVNALPESTIIFNTEQLYMEENSWNTRVFQLGQRLRIWDYSARNIERLEVEGCGRTALVPIGYHRRLERIEKQRNQNIDVLFYGSRNPRRTKILKELSDRGLVVQSLFGVYGAQRDEYVSRSKLVLNIHRSDAQIFEVVRAHYLVNNQIPVVCEINPTTRIDDCWSEIVTGVAYDQLADRCVELVADQPTREREAAEALERLKLWPQENIMTELLRHSAMVG